MSEVVKVKEEQKEVVKKENAKVKQYHVTKHKDGGWQVVLGGGEKVIRRCKTQKEAMEIAEGFAANKENTVYLHGRNGRVRDTASYKEEEKKPTKISKTQTVKVEKPAEKKPVEKKPVEKKPVEKKPVEKKPVEVKPVKEEPAIVKQETEKPVEVKPEPATTNPEPHVMTRAEKKAAKKQEKLEKKAAKIAAKKALKEQKAAQKAARKAK